METELDAKRKLDLIGDIAEMTGRTVDLVDLRRAGANVWRLVAYGSQHAYLCAVVR